MKLKSLLPQLSAILTSVVLFVATTHMAAQTSAVPFVNQPLMPDAVQPGGSAFTLTVNGTGFTTSSVVNWNGAARATTFVSSSQLTAAILASDIARAGTAAITVTTLGPQSNTVFLPVTSSTTSLTFNTGTAFATGTGPWALTTADFNHDGKLDLAVVNWTASSVSVLLGNGDGTFQPHVDYAIAAGAPPYSIADCDFNHDGNIDLAVAGSEANFSGLGNISILLGNGDGTFQPAVDYTTGPVIFSIGGADFNRDGNLDLTVNLDDIYCNLTNFCPDDLSLFLGNGTGSFVSGNEYFTGVNGDSAFTAVGDVNGDGILDLVAAIGYSEGGTIAVLPGNGDGTFGQPIITQVGYEADSVALADLNGDGQLDAIVAQGNDDRIAVLLGNGDGTFQAPITYYGALGQEFLQLPIGDFNADGKLDVATGPGSGGGCILLGNGDGTFQSSPPCFSAGSLETEFIEMTAGDFNGDGRLDVALTDFTDNEVTVVLQVPSVMLSASTLNFGNVNLGSSSAPQMVTLTNTGSAPLTISSIGIVGNDPNDFSEAETCGSTLIAGASCTITVTFTPTATGTRTASVNIADSAAGSPQTISLSGTGTQPGAQVSPTSLTFPTQVVFTTSKAETVTLTNTGTGTLTITSIVATGPFKETNTCGTTLAAGASCTINVTFSPKSKGTQTGSISVTDNASGGPQKVTLSGCGTYIQLTPASVNFGNQPVHTTSPPKKVTVSNKGSSTVTFTSIAISGSGVADFSETNTCGTRLASGASCTVTVTFTPGKQGKFSAELSFSDNGGCSPQTVSLTGTGTP